VADFDATLMKEIFDIPQRKWKTNVEHHGQADDLGAGFEVLEWRAFCHPKRLGWCPARLKRVLSDSALEVLESVAFCHPVMLGVPLAHFNQVSSDSAAS
jgi:hypothetical protein